jgi:hypothetical protein
MPGGHQIPKPKVFAAGDDVLVARVVGWGSRPEDRQAIDAVIICATPQFGDTYLVRYDDGCQDVVATNRIEAA